VAEPEVRRGCGGRRSKRRRNSWAPPEVPISS